MQTVTDDAGRLKEAQDMINKLESGINEIFGSAVYIG